MKKALPIIIILGIVTLTILVIMTLVFQSGSQSDNNKGQGTDFGKLTPPDGQAVQIPDSITNVHSVTGGQMSVNDFINNGITIPDLANPGSFVLAGNPGHCRPDGSCPAAYNTTEFSISYNSANDYFSIIILKSPLGITRSNAETFLAEQLGLSQSQMCELNYSLVAPMFVSEAYAGKQLKFSYCEGAKEL